MRRTTCASQHLPPSADKNKHVEAAAAVQALSAKKAPKLVTQVCEPKMQNRVVAANHAIQTKKQNKRSLNWTHLFVKQFAGLLLYWVNKLHLARREAHQQGDALRCRREGVEVMTRRLRSLIYPLVYGFTKICSLRSEKQERVELQESVSFTF